MRNYFLGGGRDGMKDYFFGRGRRKRRRSKEGRKE